MYGPPGTGKTTTAKYMYNKIKEKKTNALWGSIKVPDYLSCAVGKSEKNIEVIFNEIIHKASDESPVIIFFDEIDSLLVSRNKTSTADYQKRLTNVCLQWFEEINENPNVFLIGATNMPPSELDLAAVRPGRFNNHIKFILPTADERKMYLEKILKDDWFDGDKKNGIIQQIVDASPNSPYIALSTLCKTARFNAVRRGSKYLCIQDFDLSQFLKHNQQSDNNAQGDNKGHLFGRKTRVLLLINITSFFGYILYQKKSIQDYFIQHKNLSFIISLLCFNMAYYYSC